MANDGLPHTASRNQRLRLLANVENRTVHIDAGRRVLNLIESFEALRCRNPLEDSIRGPGSMTADREDALASIRELNAQNRSSIGRLSLVPDIVNGRPRSLRAGKFKSHKLRDRIGATREGHLSGAEYLPSSAAARRSGTPAAACRRDKGPSTCKLDRQIIRSWGLRKCHPTGAYGVWSGRKIDADDVPADMLGLAKCNRSCSCHR